MISVAQSEKEIIDITEKESQLLNQIRARLPGNLPQAVSAPMSMQRKKNEYKGSQEFRKNVDKFAEKASLWRTARGDGNCFYR